MNSELRIYGAGKRIDGARLNYSEYTLSLLREAEKLGLITGEEEEVLRAKIFNGLAVVIDEYTEGKSSSVSNDKANELMSSLLYNIDAYLISLKDPMKALEELNSKTVTYLFDAGGVALKRVMTDCTAVLFTQCSNL